MGDRLSHTVVPEPKRGLHRSGTMVLTRIAKGPSSFDKDLQKLVTAALASRVVDDQRVGKTVAPERYGESGARWGVSRLLKGES
jgi:hypothetical protein